jgi:adhesin transport system membrane fusion protein
VQLEDFATVVKPRRASTLLLWILAGFVVVFIIWAAFAELERTVRGSGRVIPSSQLQVISVPEGGVVQQILVTQGQQVKAGQELVRLDPTESGGEYGSGAATAGALAVKVARLEAETTGRTPSYPAAATAAAAQQIAIENALHASRMADLSSALTGARARVTQAQRAVNEAEAGYRARSAEHDARLREVQIIRPLVERGIEPRLSLSQAESAEAVSASELAAAASTISRAQAGVAEAQAGLARTVQDWRAQAATELAAAQAELSARRSTLPALAERRDRTVVRAPLPGRVNRVLVTTVGSAVAPGAPIAEIVPSEDNLLVEARVRPQDIAFVRIGQPAHVEITAYESSVYGRLDGRVVSISPDAVPEPQTGETFYHVRVQTTASALKDAQGHSLPIGPGMIANVALIGDKRTVLEYLLTPITRMRETAFRE